MTELQKKDTKPWRKWKRWVILAALVLGVMYYCGVFSGPLRITRENTGLTALPPGVEIPLRADGKAVDYVKAYEILFPEVSEITEENAWRDVVRELGESVLGDDGQSLTIMSPLPENGAEIDRAAYWAEYCRHLALKPEEVKTPDEPYVLPHEVLDAYRDRMRESFYAEKPTVAEDADEDTYPGEEEIKQRMQRFAQQHSLRAPVWEERVSDWDFERAMDALHDELFYETGWSGQQFPELAQWVRKQSPVLDMAAVAVRKPRYFMPFLKEADDQPLIEATRNGVGFQKDLAYGFVMRAVMNIHDGDAETALADIESIYRLAGHMGRMPDLIPQFAAGACVSLAMEATQGLLARNICSAEQLAQLTAMMDSQPRPISFRNAVMIGDWCAYEFLGKMAKFGDNTNMARFMFVIDPNVATKSYAALAELRYDDRHSEKLVNTCPNEFTRAVGLCTFRSRTVGEFIFTVFWPTNELGYMAVLKRMHRFHLTRLALALKRYKMEHGAYPETLAALAPEFVAEVAFPPRDIPYIFHIREHEVAVQAIKYEPEGGGFHLYYTNGDTARAQIARYSWRDEYLIHMKN